VIGPTGFNQRDLVFDAGLVSFANDGTMIPSPRLSIAARTTLGIDQPVQLTGLRDTHRANLAAHRIRHGFFFDLPLGQTEDGSSLPAL
jgi:hypothetical protein